MNKLFQRTLSLPKNRTFFLFGARNTGKRTLIKARYSTESTLYIDLLKKSMEARFKKNPDELSDIVRALPATTTHVVIDEIQKIPELLDVVHSLMGEVPQYFILTGSSARKLKSSGANLLAGRAFVYHFYPLTSVELEEEFILESALQWGTLPDIFTCENDDERREFLYAYSHTYLKEEIWNEHFVRELDPFRKFLEVAAQGNGKIINYSNIGRDVGVSDKTIQSYYQLLEDTLVGFFLETYHGSFRKRLSKQPKFYFFDTGIARALAFLTDVKLTPQTNAYGNAFEHFFILECLRLASYHRFQFKFSFLRTQDGEEIDLIVERPGMETLCIEIKSATQINAHDISTFIRLSADFKNAISICVCRDEMAKKIEHVLVLPWQQVLEQYFCR